jgi:putative Ca2+/H+ antiporter (TMEM165/GDT1 family)
MMLANVPAVWIGEKLATMIPMKAVRLFATLFVLVGIITLWSALTSVG